VPTAHIRGEMAGVISVHIRFSKLFWQTLHIKTPSEAGAAAAEEGEAEGAGCVVELSNEEVTADIMPLSVGVGWRWWFKLLSDRNSCNGPLPLYRCTMCRAKLRLSSGIPLHFAVGG